VDQQPDDEQNNTQSDHVGQSTTHTAYNFRRTRAP
jgi:hypothetical protein